MIFQEQALELLTRCPLMTPTSPSPVETCAYALASWALRRSFEGKFLGSQVDILHEIRGKIIELWKSSGNTSDPGKLSRTAGFRLFQLVLDYEVLHLEQPYNLVLSEYTIQGRYALLRKRKGANLPHVLILHTQTPALKEKQMLPPDVVSMARLLHVRTTTKYYAALALHYPVFRGDHWYNRDLNMPLAKRYLESMLRVASLRPQYPVAGDHCDLCTRPCLEVFRGQDDDSRTGR